ncbi:MAG: molecular chaperone TorD family protein [Sedimenticola sp.]|nr:molecular chaperone TorD family protein [Sedimenticola sp.]
MAEPGKAMQAGENRELQEIELAIAPPELTELSEEQVYRAGAYGLLASLLRRAPDPSVLQQVSGFAAIRNPGDEMALAMSMLGLAASRCQVDTIADEYHDLFIGIGRGELVPYGSWYQTGFLMERPLGHLRDDLAELGLQRDPDVCEPEDHVAALCEVMQLLINDGVSHARQAQFFSRHMAQWLERFFQDLSEARGAVFYRAVGRFGAGFSVLETRYLGMQV